MWFATCAAIYELTFVCTDGERGGRYESVGGGAVTVVVAVCVAVAPGAVTVCVAVAPGAVTVCVAVAPGAVTVCVAVAPGAVTVCVAVAPGAVTVCVAVPLLFSVIVVVLVVFGLMSKSPPKPSPMPTIPAAVGHQSTSAFHVLKLLLLFHLRD